MATTQKIRNDIAKTKDKIAELQKKQRALEAQLAEEENLEIVRMVKAVAACLRTIRRNADNRVKDRVPYTSYQKHRTYGCCR